MGQRMLAQSGQEFDKMRVQIDIAANRQHIADRSGLAGRKLAGIRIGFVAVLCAASSTRSEFFRSPRDIR
jgi:hypothetical protein